MLISHSYTLEFIGSNRRAGDEAIRRGFDGDSLAAPADEVTGRLRWLDAQQRQEAESTARARDRNLGIWPAALEPLACALNRSPRHLREIVYRVSGWMEAIPAHRLPDVRAEALSRWVVDQYPRRRYRAVAIGSSNGAAVHLWAALGIPWLPRTFLILSARVSTRTNRGIARVGTPSRPALLAANADLQLHHMHDANQDR